MALESHPRKQLFVDHKVQGALALRVVLYWCACLVTMSLMLVCWRILTGAARLFYLHFDEMWFHYGPALLASFLLLPLVVVDVLRLSNRFTGPLVRLRRAMRALARGESVAPIHFRENDFWREFADEFNALAARVQAQAVSKSRPASEDGFADCGEAPPVAVSAVRGFVEKPGGHPACTAEPRESPQEQEPEPVGTAG